MDSKKNATAIMLLVVGAIAVFAGFMIFRESGEDEVDNANQAANIEQLPIDLQLNNLEPLSSGIYEGWVVRGDDKFSFGRFNTTENGDIDGELSLGDVTPRNGDTIAISIEPMPDADPEPSATIILAGEIENGSADLAFPLDISEFAGSYILATPTNGDNTNETSGIWFVDLPGPTVSLDLPIAPEGWIYEGWAVFEGNPLTSGKFRDPAAADLFDGYSGPEPGPPFPGEDFLENLPFGYTEPIELANGSSMVVISLEPDQDGTDPTGEGPAQVKPLVHMIEAGAADHASFNLELDTSSLPSGSASL